MKTNESAQNPAAGSNGVTINLAGVESPYLAQYLGLWSMAPHIFEEAAARIAGMDLRVHVESQRLKKLRERAEGKSDGSAESRAGDDEPRPTTYSYEVTPGGVAILDAVGTLMKAESSFGDSTSTVMLRRTIRQIRAQHATGRVSGLMMRIDSPGGTTDGTEELANELAAAAADMPVAAYIDGLGASAAYWLASQAPTISANATAIVGSIGTYAAVRDTSAAYAQMGVKVHVIRSAEAKGAGVPGTEITPKQLAEWQRMIDASQTVFTEAVAKGRKVSIEKATEWADARVHVGREAKAIGLIDQVESFEAAVSRLEARAGKANQSKNNIAGGRSAGDTEKAVADAPPPAVESEASASAGAESESPMPAATMAELKKALPGATDSLLVEMSEKSMDLPTAKDHFVGWQAAQIRSRDESIKANETEIGKLKTENADLKTRLEAAEKAGAKNEEHGGKSEAGKTQARPGVPPAASRPVEGAVDVASIEDPKERAKAEWEANTDGCRKKFSSEKSFIAARSRELTGKVTYASMK